jgi:hypothetical protein
MLSYAQNMKFKGGSIMPCPFVDSIVILPMSLYIYIYRHNAIEMQIVGFKTG